MTLLLYVLSAVLLSVGLYRLAQAALAFPSGKSIHAIQNIHGKRSLTQRFQSALLPVAKTDLKAVPHERIQAQTP